MQHWSDKDFKGSLRQEITLPNGVYDLKAYTKSSGSFNKGYIYVKGYMEMMIELLMSKMQEMIGKNLRLKIFK